MAKPTVKCGSHAQSRRNRRRGAAVLLVGALLLACPDNVTRPPEDRPLAVRVRTLTPQRHDLRKTFVGEVRPWRSITVSAQIGERITALHCDKGDAVTTGQLLAQIDDRNVRFDLRDAQTRVTELEQLLAKTRSLTRPQELATLEARCAQCEADFRTADLEYKRARQLLADRVISQSRFDQIEAALEAARAQRDVANEALALAREGARSEDVRAAEVQLERVRVAVERARKRVADSRVESPAKAIVVRRYHEIGETVRPGEPLFELADIDRVKVLLQVGERDLVQLRRTQEVTLVADAIPGRMFDGFIRYVSDVADAVLRTFDVEVAVDNYDHVLKPGMVARVTVVVDSVERALVVPETLIVEYAGEKGFLYLASETAAFHPLGDAVRDGDRWIVSAPDAPIGPVIETRTTRLTPGATVQVVDEPASADTRNPQSQIENPQSR